ncbi:MAG TPA: hypothetical protein VFU49_02930 [Ktedonobacteraceae bacterium]|nr:hypothetical protein [Ktedonobacteraceae bacterium]
MESLLRSRQQRDKINLVREIGYFGLNAVLNPSWSRESGRV